MVSVTIKDVAKKANVSVATVSRVLNGSDKVTEETRDKVLAICDSLGYAPNLQAKGLKLGRTHTIMAVLPFLTLPSIVERLRGLQESLADSGYDLVPFSVGTPEQRKKYVTSISSKSRTDGVLFISIPITEKQAERFKTQDIPVVLIDSYHPDLKRVVVDNIAGGKMAVDHLIDLGHSKIGFISDHLINPLHFSSMKDRHEGYCQALKKSGIPLNPQYIQHGNHGRVEAKAMALKLLQLPQPPTAIFSASDTQAIGVLDAAKELNIDVPEDLSVVGYDDIRDAGYLELTTIKQPLFEAGLAGGKSLLNIINDEDSSTLEKVLPVSLVVRNTTARILAERL